MIRALVTLVALGTLMLTGCGTGDRSEEPALTVDGQTVPTDELRMYAVAHSLDLGTGEGRQAAIDGIVRFKVMQQQAHARKLIGYVDYPGFLTDLQSRNAGNASAIEQGQAVYGVASYEPAAYLSYVESTVQHRLQLALIAEKRLSTNDAALRAFYTRNKDKYAKKVDTIILTLSRPPTSGRGIAVTVGTVTIDDRSAYTYSKYRPALYTVALRLSPGRSAPVVGDTGGELLLAYCRSRIPAGYKTFEEVHQEITQRYEDEQFQRYLDSLAAGAAVVVSPQLPDLVP